MTEILPCPFCGSSNIDPEGWMSCEPDGSDKKTGPACDDCAGSTESIERWNTRPAPQPSALQLVTPNVETWIERNFSGHGRALRALRDPPIDAEPFMSMADAKQLLRDGIREFSASPLPPLARQALEVARKRIAYFGTISDDRHREANEQYFFPPIDAALALPRPNPGGEANDR